MKMLYISQGNIPSRWAHTTQAMKMAEAFHRHERSFALATAVYWKDLFRRRYDFETHYGIQDPFRIARLPLRKTFSREDVHSPVFAEAAVRYAVRKRPEVVYTRSPFAGPGCVREGIPTMMELHALPDKNWDALAPVVNESAFLGLVTLTDALKAEYVSAGVPEEKVFVWPDAVDIDAYAGGERHAFRKPLDMPLDKKIAVYSGHLYKDRGVDQVIQAMKGLPEWELWCVGGWDEHVAEHQALAEVAGVTNVRFTGHVDQSLVPRYLQAADALVLSYTLDAFPALWGSPLKLFEYLAAERPIVAVDVPATRDPLTHEDTALIIPPDDAAAWREGLLHIQENPEAAREMAERGRAFVASYTWDRRAGDILAFIAQRKAAAI